MRSRFLFFLILSFIVIDFRAQDSEIDRLIEGELKMTFPSVHFKNNSIDYAPMPYKADSCFKYIATHTNEIHGLVIWRDNSEPEQLTIKRIKKLEADLQKFLPNEKMEIVSMGSAQKISQKTIKMGADTLQKQYLLSLNSVVDVPRTTSSGRKARKYRNHIESPRLFCWGCVSSGFHFRARQRLKKAKRMRERREGKRK